MSALPLTSLVSCWSLVSRLEVAVAERCLMQTRMAAWVPEHPPTLAAGDGLEAGEVPVEGEGLEVGAELAEGDGLGEELVSAIAGRALAAPSAALTARVARPRRRGWLSLIGSDLLRWWPGPGWPDRSGCRSG